MNRLLLFVIIIHFLSCTREEGFIPGPERYDPHYYDLTPELDWCSQWSNQNVLVSFAAVNNYIIVNTENNKTFIFESDSGEVISAFNTDLPYPGDGINGPVQIIDNGAYYYLIEKNRPRVFKITKDQGSLIEVLAPVSSDSAFNASGEVVPIDDSILFIFQNEDRDISLTSFNYITEDVTEIAQLDSLELAYDFAHRMVYSQNTRSLYVLSLDDNDTYKVFSVQIGSGAVTTILSQNKENVYVRPFDLSISENHIYPQFDGKLYCIEIPNNTITWTLQSDIARRAGENFVHLNSLYVKHAYELLKLDPETGSLIWESDLFSNGSYSMVPGEEFAVSTIDQQVEQRGSDYFFTYRNLAAIYELNEGKRLVEWDSYRADTTVGGFFKDILYHENDFNDKIIYVATDSTLCKYQWPF